MATVQQDGFDSGADVALSGRSATVGGTWAVSGTGGAPTLYSGTSAVNFNSDAYIATLTAPTSANYSATANSRFTATDTGLTEIRLRDTGSDYYRFVRNCSFGTNLLTVEKWVGGAQVGGALYSASFTPNTTTDFKMEFRVGMDGNANSVRALFNDAEVYNAIDASSPLTTAGNAKLRGRSVDVRDWLVSDDASGDTTAPTLSSPTSAATGKDAGSGTVTTDEGNGTLYAVVTLTATAPTAAQVKAGQNAAGTGLAAGLKPTLAVSSTGAKTVSFTGLTTATAYYPYFAHEDAAGNISTVSSGAAFTPSTLAYSGTVGAQTGVQGFAFVWSGVNPSTLYSGGIGTKSYTGTGLSGSGLTVSSSTGVLSGTCGTPGTYTVAIVGTDQSTAGTEIPQTETSNSFTLTISASGDTTRPTLTGVVTPSAVTATTATATWPAGADNAAIAGYDYQLNGGSFTSLGNVLTVNLTGLTASTAYTINVRARDTSGNVSAPVITGGFTTNSASAGTFTSAVLKRNTGVVVASSSLTWVAFMDAATGAAVVVKTGISTNGSGVFSATDAALTTGTYHATWLEASGQRGYGVAAVA